jgi:hypothetical protein
MYNVELGWIFKCTKSCYDNLFDIHLTCLKIHNDSQQKHRFMITS